MLDLMHAVERRARAYEERCETNLRQYTPLRNRSQAPAARVARWRIVLPGMPLLPTVDNSITGATRPRRRLHWLGLGSNEATMSTPRQAVLVAIGSPNAADFHKATRRHARDFGHR